MIGYGGAVRTDVAGSTFADKVVEAIGVIRFMGHMVLMAAGLIGEHTPQAGGDITGDLQLPRAAGGWSFWVSPPRH